MALPAASCALAPSIYSLGPAMLAEVCPPAQRGALLSIDASISSIAGILAPLVTGYLVQNATGAHGYETGFAVCGALMIVGGLAGAAMTNPERSRQRMAGLQLQASAARNARPAHA
ncbi:MFS transporter [Cupriavidus sp. WKF15]|uniref:MFS transporter n=1 Tax=Cupriavidus sp. WKF15 TaxID=3032282 RepID=UPI0023E1E4D4|nr:MFS transporter [Cupriavidus sp. WKF15]WER48590.1 MFS transporter [Cupriavidus sp. WKF15]